ncbi:MAG: hypothetical protein HY895_21660 [Deltaproteobacteria bacterium]|nr:hypothetical protein [Deltaproteobacteria bacterium]
MIDASSLIEVLSLMVLMATGEASELHLSKVGIAKLEIMIEDSQACANKG